MKKYFIVSAAVLLMAIHCMGAPLKSGTMPEKGAVLLDVRSVTEYRTGHLRSAVNLPLDRLEKEIRSLVQNTETPVYLYCRSGRRSANAVKVLQKMNYKKLYDLGGMTDARKKLSLPIVK